jgi:hypothetical protein
MSIDTRSLVLYLAVFLMASYGNKSIILYNRGRRDVVRAIVKDQRLRKQVADQIKQLRADERRRAS